MPRQYKPEKIVKSETGKTILKQYISEKTIEEIIILKWKWTKSDTN